jgi:phosphoglycerate-specific signal transduction histidine kinase
VPTDLPDSDLGDFVDLHARLSGVIKDDKLNVVALANKNVNFPSHKYFSFVDAFHDINAFNKRPLTLNERKELQEVVNESRKRTKQIASRVYTKVWLKEA